MRENKLIAFFTNKIYRKATIELLKIKFLKLPGIRNIFSFWVNWRFAQKTQHMDPWERHVFLKKMEHQTEQFVFTSCLIRLYASIVAVGEYRNDEDFLKCKQEVLECKFIQQEELREFREWVQQIEPDETDGTRVKDMFDKYTSGFETTN